MPTEIKPFVESNDVLDQPDMLREHAKRDGYLFFRNLIDPDTILQLRRDFLEICDKHGWIKEGTDLMDGIRNGGPFREGQEEYWPILDDFQSLESFHAFAHYPSIIDVCDKLFGEPTLAHPRNIGRIMFPRKHKVYDACPSRLHSHSRHGGDLYRLDPFGRLSTTFRRLGRARRVS